MAAYYKHYKTGTVYELLGEAQHSETNEKLALYKVSSSEKIWARPTYLFYGDVEVDGKMVKRFEKVINKPGDNPCGEIDLLPRC